MIRNHSRHGSRFPITLGGGGGYSVAKSLRFRSSASAYLNRTFGTPTNNIKWTWSAWVKRGKLSSAGVLFQGYSSLSNRTALQFNSSDQLVFNGSVATATTTAVFRDPAAWYHIVCVYDSANATAADRLLLYVNGTVQTVTGTQPTASQVEYINGAWLHYISTGYSGAFEYLDEDLAEVNFVDGQALVPTAFGAFSTYNQWLPIKYAGTYGTNGFYLPFNSVSTSSYAGSFNGTSQYLSVAKNAAFEPAAAQPWTVEAWVYITSFTNASEVFAYTNAAVAVGTDIGTYMLVNATTGTITGGMYNGVSQYAVTSSAGLPLNAWVHCALVSSGSAIAIYVNGLSVGSTATALAPNVPASATLKIGYFDSVNLRYLSGQISNFRFVKGTAVYTANFIPPTAALTAITNTSLLTLQNATIVDNSTNAFTITNNGTVVTSVQSPFLNTTVLTADSSGNANNWTPNNISLTAGSTYDSLTDVPTLTSTTVANYAVLSPIHGGSGSTLSNANLTWSITANNTTAGSIGMSSGKWYWEVTAGSNTYEGIVLSTVSLQNQLAGISGAYCYSYVGNIYAAGNIPPSVSSWGASYTSGDIIGVVFDASAGTLGFYKNNVFQGTAYSGIAAGTYMPAVGSDSISTATGSINFGQRPFTYTPPTGFLPLNTFNIAAGTVTTSGTFTGNASTDGPMVWLNGTPTAMTINGNAVTFGAQADKLANGFKVRSSSASYNASGSNTYVATTVGAVFKYEDAQGNP